MINLAIGSNHRQMSSAYQGGRVCFWSMTIRAELLYDS
jgi:hypothetical protein